MTYSKQFRKEPPLKQIFLRGQRKLFQTGSVKDKPRTGRPKSRGTECREVDDVISKSPKKSTRNLSAKLEVPRTTLRRHMKVDLELFPYRPMLGQELSDDACGRMLQEFRTMLKRKRFIFSNECAVYRSSRSQNIVCVLVKAEPTLL